MSRRSSGVVGLAVLACLAMATGCSDDGGPKPVRLVALSADSTGVEICATIEIGAQVRGGQGQGVDWYVNGILGGAAGIGTINQTNPAILTAPLSIPDPPTVTVRAVSREDTTKADSCRVTVKFTVLHVNASEGSDDTGTGCLTHPYKSIKRALTEAGAGMTILAAPGLYDAANGEEFPVTLPAGVALVGEDWETTIIRGHAAVGSYHSAFYLTSEHPSLRKLTLEMGEPAGEPWDVAIYVGGVGGVVDSIRMSERGDYSNVRVSGADSATVSNCRFVVDEGPYEARGFEIVFGDQATIIRGCTVTGFHTGLFFNGTSDALVEGCILEGNGRGIELCCPSDPGHDPGPDFGGGARLSDGGNVIRNNADYGFYHRGTLVVSAKNNTWNSNPPTFGSAPGSDIYLANTGTVDWE